MEVRARAKSSVSKTGSAEKSTESSNAARVAYWVEGELSRAMARDGKLMTGTYSRLVRSTSTRQD